MWLAKILSFVIGGGLSSIADKLEKAYQAKLAAANDSEKIRADVTIQQLEAQRDSILAAQRDRFERWVRIAFAFPFVVYLNKTVFWDKIIGGVTDPLSPLLTQIMWTVIGGYFLISTAKIIRK